MRDPRWGVCPTCHKSDGCINIGASHWYYCNEHKAKWCVGSNLFSSWRNQTEDEQRAIYDELDFGSFTEVFEDAHTPEGAHQGAHHPLTERLHKNIGKEEEDALSLSKVLNGAGETGFVRDPEGHGCTCSTCGGHFGTYAGWRAHVLRGRCYRPVGAVQ